VTTAAGTVAGSLRFDLQALGADRRRGRLRTVTGAGCGRSPGPEGHQLRKGLLCGHVFTLGVGCQREISPPW